MRNPVKGKQSKDRGKEAMGIARVLGLQVDFIQDFRPRVLGPVYTLLHCVNGRVYQYGPDVRIGKKAFRQVRRDYPQVWEDESCTYW